MSSKSPIPSVSTNNGPKPSSSSSLGDADFAKAFQEVARGEQTASAMEAQLTALEQKIDHLLASAEEQQSTLATTTPAVKGEETSTSTK